MTVKDVSNYYDTVLAVPGMANLVKIDLKISRKTVVMLVQAIERGMKEGKAAEGDLFALVPEEAKKDLSDVITQCLEKSEMGDLMQRLKTLFSK